MEIFDIRKKKYINNIELCSIENIYFINFAAHGDILYSKQFVIDIISKLKNKSFNYVIDNGRKKVLNDIYVLNMIYLKDFIYIDNLLFISDFCSENLDINIGYKKNLTPYFIQVLDNNLFINTWVFSFIGNTKPVELLSTYYNYFSKNLYPILNINIEESDFYDFTLTKKILTIDTSVLNSDKNYNVLLLDGECTSGQVENFSLDDIGLFLVSRGYTVITSHSNNDLFININKLVKTDDQNGNLLEIQKISTMCKLIIGRNSGLMQHTFIKENIGTIYLLFTSFLFWRPKYLNIFSIFCRNKDKKQCINECLFMIESLTNYGIK